MTQNKNNLVMSNKRDEAKLAVSLLMTTVLLGFGITQIYMGATTGAYGLIPVGVFAVVAAMCLYATAYYVATHQTKTEDMSVPLVLSV